MADGGAPGETPGPGSTPGAGASPAAPGAAPVRRASDALATGPSAPRERGWWRLVVALLAFLMVPYVPMLRAIAPIEQTLLLVVTAMAACALVGWWAGGRLALAASWVLLAAVVIASPAPTGAVAYDKLVRGWALLLAASFGLVCVFGQRRPLLGRALSAVGVAVAVALVAMAAGTTSPERLRDAVRAELDARTEESVRALREVSASPGWRQFVADHPGAASLATQSEQQLREVPQRSAAIFPALLGIESLMALALAWSIYHRVSRARLGPPLARVREFRFNDQLVWGLIVGLVVLLLPSLSGLKPVGMNLVVFFGALYALRGFGVLAWFLAPDRIGLAPLIGFALLMPPLVGAVALGLGLGDTWVDWRTRGARHTT
ncbi:MAG: DUF2232 domain-containing protein [Gemmatimonadaceae bacterium]